MYLKSLEVHGFKSFANKLVFEFHDGITAIVGPNGSGKSNVADSVRWVLGEQSAKQLRGAKMEDVIFAGTELKRPLGFAYVAITFSNEDHKLNIPYEEVTVSRRVYRSGESEYMINGTACRLRDINELFFDTGVGKEGYSIIGQGQIDKILSGKPEERRELFDEAAGIVKYKKRKAETEKKLENEKQNMVRVEDILAELEIQRGPLNEEALKARKFLDLRDELRTLDINVFLNDYEEFSKKAKEIDEKIENIDVQYQEKEKDIQNTEQEYTRVEGEIKASEESIEETKDKITENELLINNLNNDIALIHEQINSVKNNEAHYNERNAQLKDDISARQKALRETEEEKKNNEEIAEDFEKKSKENSEESHNIRLKLREIENKIKEKDEDIQKENDNSTRLKTHKQKYVTLYEQNSVNKASITQKLIKNKTENTELNEQAEIEKDIYTDMEEKIDAINAMESTLKEGIVKLKNKTLDLQREVNELQSQYHIENSRLLSIRNMTERYEGFGQSIKRVMEQKDKNPGIIGVVADVIKTPEKYEMAIETALGGQIQNIVTDTQSIAREMIGFLKKNRYGRATFLPLDHITPGKSNIPDTAFKEMGSLGVASSLVEVDSKFDNLMEYLLGRVLVVDNIDNAIKIANKYNHRFRMVTLEGDLINPGGAMSGGAYKNNNNLLGRRREIEALEASVKELVVNLKEKRNLLNENESLIEKERAKLEGNNKLKGDFQIKLNTAKVNYKRILKDIENNEAELLSIKSDLEGSNDEQSTIQSKLDSYNSQINEYLERVKALEEKKKTYTDKKKELNKELTEALDNSSKFYVEVSNARQRVVFNEQTIERLNNELASKRNELEKLINDNTNFDSILKEKDDEIQAKKDEIHKEEENKKAIEAELEEKNNYNQSLKKKNKDFLKMRENLVDEKNTLDKEKIRLSNQKEKMESQSVDLVNYMWEQYEITYNNALELKTETELSNAQLKKKISELKSEIKKLGDVNVNSIEKSAEVNKRYDLLSSQHDDIIVARDKLIKIIEELDERMRETFTEEFKKIQESFNDVFRELFGGGKGQIELMDDEDVLTCGINIIAQPPGKKLQNMLQLSGGEKALTAISLLFAIQKLKPSPFCLLDEIEAALDDSNVDRFANYLHKLTKDTQFIVITHRRGTMNAADILYGITMQEKGISTLVSVDLVEAESYLDEEPKKSSNK